MIQFHPSVNNIVRIAALQFSDMLVVPKSDELWEEIELLVQQLRATFSAPAEASTELVPARQLYRNIGIDPTKNRPSSEALLRRTLKGHGLYQINSVVDIIWSQLFKSERSLKQSLKSNDFNVLRSASWSDEKNLNILIFELETNPIPIVRKHLGPQIYRKLDSEHFLKKHLNAKDTTIGPWIDINRWAVGKKRMYRSW